MDKFFDRFKPKKKSGNPLGGLFSGQKSSFHGQGQSLGGSQPGQVLPIELSEAGPLGIQVEKRPNSQKTAIVAMVVPGSQAERAGIQRGDILCFAGSNGTEEIMYDMFIELAKSNQRPLCFEVRRIKTKSTGTVNQKSADNFARKQAVIAAAEAREKAHKKKQKPIPKKVNDLPNLLSTAERQKLEDERLERLKTEKEVPKSEASRKAIEAAKNSEAQTAASLGYNPYETNRATAGQARTANVAMTHGSIEHTEDSGSASIPAVRTPKETVEPEKEVAISPQFLQAYETAVTMNDHAAVISSFGILRKLLTNATTKGQNSEDEVASAKFRRVRLGNAKIKAAVVDIEGAVDMMLCAGFQLVEEDGESVLVYPPGDKGPEWLPGALKQMESYEKS